MKTNSSGYMMIVLLVSVIIIMLLSVYVMNKVYFKQSEDLKENGLIDSDSPSLQNPQNQVDAARERVNEIQDEYNKKLDDSITNN